MQLLEGTMRIILCLAAGIMIFGQVAWGQSPKSKIKVTLVKNAYSGSREEAEISPGPDALQNGGLADVLKQLDCETTPPQDARLTQEEDRQYGAWNRMGMANGHLGKLVADTLRAGSLPIGLLANCNSLMGMLAGLQHSGAGRPLKVGLVWIDAHADFNTPETTLSGMLGGMPVAVSTGLCLTRFRLQSGLEPALPFSYVVMVAVRDTDPLEQELVDRHRIETVPAGELRPPFVRLDAQMRRLGELTDLIYVHIDMDVLDPGEVSGHPLTVPGGPGSNLLGAALETIFKYRKAAALGIASYPAQRDPDKISLKAAYRLVEGCIRGLQAR
jgi:arginase